MALSPSFMMLSDFRFHSHAWYDVSLTVARGFGARPEQGYIEYVLTTTYAKCQVRFPIAKCMVV